MGAHFKCSGLIVALIFSALNALELDVKTPELIGGLIRQDFATVNSLVSESSKPYRKLWISHESVLPEFSYHVSIERGEEDAVCSGAVIQPGNVVVTAASCNVRDTDIVRINSPKRFRGGLVAGIKCITNHPMFKAEKDANNPSAGHVFEYDVAVLQLNLTVTHNIQPLNVRPRLALIKLANVTSYSQYSHNSRHALMYTKVSVSRKCTNFGYEMTNKMVCAGSFKPNVTYCNEDRGNPLAFGGLLIGIKSWGEQCSRLLMPSVYTLIAGNITQWIRSSITYPNS